MDCKGSRGVYACADRVRVTVVIQSPPEGGLSRGPARLLWHPSTGYYATGTWEERPLPALTQGSLPCCLHHRADTAKGLMATASKADKIAMMGSIGRGGELRKNWSTRKKENSDKCFHMDILCKNYGLILLLSLASEKTIRQEDIHLLWL